MEVVAFILLLFCISFCGFRRTQGLGLDSSLCLRGIMVLLVVFHHLPPDSNAAIGYFQSACGRYAVDLFFFMSGYGLMTQYVKKGKEAVMQGYLVRRYTKLLLPWLVAVLLFYFAGGCSVTWQNVVENWRTGESIVPFGYFVEELALFYLLFWVAYRFFPKAAALAICILGTLGMVGAFIAWGWNPHWWISSMAFPAGIATVYMEKHFMACRMLYAVAAAVLMALAGLLPNFTGMEDLQFKLLRFSLLFTPLACWVVYLLWPLVRVRTAAWVPLNFFGRISYEMYILQGLVIGWLSGCDIPCASLLVLAGAAAVGWCVWKFDAFALPRLVALLQRQPKSSL